MPNIKSAKKRLRQSEKRNARNRSAKSELKSIVKKAQEATAKGDPESALKAIRLAGSALDHVAGKKIIHKNAARRKKSRLMKNLNKAKASS